jgi:hypothetical protein
MNTILIFNTVEYNEHIRGEKRYSRTLSWPGYQMEDSVQIHTPVTVQTKPRGKFHIIKSCWQDSSKFLRQFEFTRTILQKCFWSKGTINLKYYETELSLITFKFLLTKMSYFVCIANADVNFKTRLWGAKACSSNLHSSVVCKLICCK